MLAECASNIMLTCLLRANEPHGLSTPVAMHSASIHIPASPTCSAGRLAHPLDIHVHLVLETNEPERAGREPRSSHHRCYTLRIHSLLQHNHSRLHISK